MVIRKATDRRWLPAPDLPRLRLRPRSPYLLLTMGTGERGRELLRVSEPLLRQYARRHKLDFRVIGGEVDPYPCGRKWDAAAYLQHYERVVWIDADTVIHPGMPNLLEVVPSGRIGIHNDYPFLHAREWVHREYEALCRSQGYALSWPDAAWNTGVWVADREHASIFGPPARPFPHFHCSEQDHIGLRIHQERVPLTLLASEFNWQYWVRRVPMYEPCPGVWVHHWADQQDHAERLRQMRSVAEKLSGQQEKPQG